MPLDDPVNALEVSAGSLLERRKKTTKVVSEVLLVFSQSVIVPTPINILAWQVKHGGAGILAWHMLSGSAGSDRPSAAMFRAKL